MQFPAAGITILTRLYYLYRSLAEGTDDQRRTLTRMMAEQLAFSLDSSWGTKSADSGRPQSKDSLSFYVGADTFWNWDWQNGTTRKIGISLLPPDYTAGPEGTLITDQHFIPVTPTDHLGGGIVDPVPDPTPTPAPAPVVDLSGILSRLQALEMANEAQAVENKRLDQELGKALNQLQQAGNRLTLVELRPKPLIPTRAVGSVFGLRVSLKLE